MTVSRTPHYEGFTPASARSSQAARGSSRKVDTKPELILRRALWRKGLRYRKNCRDLPGNPDIVFRGSRVVVFVDGDFWHGRDWPTLKAKLKRGHNAEYWLRKIERNTARDREKDRALRMAGWHVLRVWESEVYRDLNDVVRRVETTIRQQRSNLSPGGKKVGSTPARAAPEGAEVRFQRSGEAAGRGGRP